VLVPKREHGLLLCQNGKTVLMFACEKGQEAVVQHLLGAGAKISCKDKASDVAQLLYFVSLLFALS
jgi:ankyrin repeat protein